MDKQQYARRVVQAPAVALIVVGAIGIALQLFSLVFGPAAQQAAFDWVERMAADSPGFDPAKWQEIREMGGGSALLDALWSLGIAAVSAVVLAGGIQMLKLRTWGLAISASILAMLPCCGPCCCIGLPVGIWAAVVLLKPEVRDVFEGRTGGPGDAPSEEQSWGGG